MKCIDPVLCYAHENGKRFFRHFSIVSKFYPWRLSQPHIVLDCGQCIFCRKARAFELACRCVLHSSLYDDNCFLTLTYDEKRPGYHNNFEYEDIQKFKKRLRQHVWRKHKKRMEIFNVHEYGKNGKKHWHLIVFNWVPSDCRLYTTSGGLPLYTSEELQGMWEYGYSTIGSVSEASAMYQAQYVEKDLRNGNRTNSKKSHSKHSGLARPYFLKHYRQLMGLGYLPFSGRKLPLPRYFEKLAHKHYAHFYEPSAFHDTRERKALYRPFKTGEAQKELADLYESYKERKNAIIEELEKNWQEVVTQYLATKELPDFKKSGDNYLYDMAKLNKQEKF